MWSLATDSEVSKATVGFSSPAWEPAWLGHYYHILLIPSSICVGTADLMLYVYSLYCKTTKVKSSITHQSTKPSDVHLIHRRHGMLSCHKSTEKSSYRLLHVQAGSSSLMHVSPFHENSGHMPECLHGGKGIIITVKEPENRLSWESS